MDADRIERLVTQVLEETRAFRQETKQEIAGLRQEMREGFARLDGELDAVRQDIGRLQTAVLDVSRSVQRVEAKVDSHGQRLDKLEGAAE